MTSLPNISDAIGPVLRRMSSEQRPLLLAAAEKLAAKRYREWAQRMDDARIKNALLACADREEEVAQRIEELFPNAESLQKGLLSAAPELIGAGDSLFAPYSLQDQFIIQAQGERGGASTWRKYAERSTDVKARETFLQCAVLEEESAIFLESLAGQQF